MQQHYVFSANGSKYLVETGFVFFPVKLRVEVILGFTVAYRYVSRLTAERTAHSSIELDNRKIICLNNFQVIYVYTYKTTFDDEDKTIVR